MGLKISSLKNWKKHELKLIKLFQKLRRKKEKQRQDKTILQKNKEGKHMCYKKSKVTRLSTIK